MGIKLALSHRDCEFIWLLDGDTICCSDTLLVLLNSWEKLVKIHNDDKIGLTCFRPDHQVDIARGIPSHRCYSKPGCFFGFHFFNIPYRLWRFTPWGVQNLLRHCQNLSKCPMRPLVVFCPSLSVPSDRFAEAKKCSLSRRLRIHSTYHQKRRQNFSLH